MSDRITVGNVEILAFVDIGPAPRDPAMVFPDVPADAWGAYKDTMTPDGLLPFQMGFFALRSGGQTMLVDTGLGRGPHEAMGGIGGKLMDQLSGAGINADDISRVLITHLHGDHVGWNITWDGDTARATFPNATYSVPQGRLGSLHVSRGPCELSAHGGERHPVAGDERDAACGRQRGHH